jgi:hypothetical protein
LHFRNHNEVNRRTASFKVQVLIQSLALVLNTLRHPAVGQDREPGGFLLLLMHLQVVIHHCELPTLRVTRVVVHSSSRWSIHSLT